MQRLSLLLLLVILLATLTNSLAQNTGTIKGRILSSDGTPASYVPIGLKGTKHGTTTNEKGEYQLNAPAGSHTLLVHFIGHEHEEKQIVVKENETLQIEDFKLRESFKELHEVEVTGKSKVQEVKESSFNVTSIDARPLHNVSLDINQVLNRTAGVRIREEGGLGSNFNFSLNGFSGRQVKFFIDGIPMDNFGSSFQLNNIPINLAERIEVYKGVVPMWLGSDALGGAVNVITSNKSHTYLDASYSFGSFNTHKSAVNAGFTSKRGISVQINAFQNYSDNNYWVHVEAADLRSGRYYGTRRLRRFNDNYHNETVIANVGVVGKKYADKLLFGITLGQNRAEVQTGVRMESVFGDWYRKGNIVMPSISYQKNNLLVKGLDFTLNANYNLGQEQNVDTVNIRYNWLQQFEKRSGAGSERTRSLYKYRNNNGLVVANLNVRLSERNTITINNVLNHFNRKGSDPLFPENESYEQPRISIKNVLGLGYKFDFNKRWSTSVFLKYFYLNNKYSVTYNPIPGKSDIAYRKLSAEFIQPGYGIATSYFITKGLQAKASFEKSCRMPSNEELFGDVVNIEASPSLKPESSNNYNIGFNYDVQLFKNHYLSVEGNFIYRDTRDFIRTSLNTNEILQKNSNQGKVLNWGTDGGIKYSYKRAFHIGGNVTYQNLRNYTRFEQGQTVQSIYYLDRMPNIPYLYGNGNSSITLKIPNKKTTISLGYNVLYVHEYYLYWPSLGTESSKRGIPTQISHDANLVFSMKDGRYNLAVECRNFTDNRLYDNFSLQKPGRAFYIKLRYFITKNNLFNN